MSIIAKFYPNGEFSQGVDTSKKRKDNCNHREIPRPRLSLRCRDRYSQWIKEYEAKGTTPDKAKEGDYFLSASGNKYRLHESSRLHTTLHWQDESGAQHYTSIPEGFMRAAFLLGLIPLVHQMVEFCDKSKSRKKLTSMTKRMGRNIRNAVYLLEKQPGGKDVISFLTLTIPSLSQEGLTAVCANWDKLVKLFMDWLRVTLKRKHIDFLYVYCTEIQSKRLQQRNEYAPHLHLVFKGRNAKKSPWAVTPKQCRKAWGRALASIVAEPFRTDALENLQRIKRSAARYLSKYLSKGLDISALPAEANYAQALRTQWGGMARPLARAVRQASLRFTSDGIHRETLMAFIQCLELLRRKGFIAYYRRGFIPLANHDSDGDERGLHVCAGALSTPTYEGGLIPIMEYLGKLLDAGMVSRIVTEALTNVA